jgi:hypothetical protein
VSSFMNCNTTASAAAAAAASSWSFIASPRSQR